MIGNETKLKIRKSKTKHLVMLCIAHDQVFGDHNVAVLTPLFFIIINDEANRVKTVSVFSLIYSKCLYTCILNVVFLKDLADRRRLKFS
jgi:hypothetical protein